MSTDFKCVLLDLEKRQAITLPTDMRTAAEALIGEQSSSS